jgi:hypothetical protein
MWFFFSFFLNNERKPYKTSHIYLLMINAANDNSKASKSNQCPNIFSTLITKDKTSIIIWDMCQVKMEGHGY